MHLILKSTILLIFSGEGTETESIQIMIEPTIDIQIDTLMKKVTIRMMMVDITIITTINGITEEEMKPNVMIDIDNQTKTKIMKQLEIMRTITNQPGQNIRKITDGKTGKMNNQINDITEATIARITIVEIEIGHQEIMTITIILETSGGIMTMKDMQIQEL